MSASILPNRGETCAEAAVCFLVEDVLMRFGFADLWLYWIT
jgi:hypothetical protein